MPKNIIVCSDGTGNSSIKGRGTNVFKLYEAIDLNGHRSDPDLTPQLALYDDGVGTEEFKPIRIFAGMTGYGLGRNVKQLYRELARVYDPGDRIFLFGFSRGGFTARTLGGLIARCGIVDPSRCETARKLDQSVAQAYRAYRRCYRTVLATIALGPADEGQAETFKQRHCHPDDVRIAFIGVWDTVDAVGLPFHLSDILNTTLYRFKFPDHRLSGIVDRACQALAIDDERHAFAPLLWDESGDESDRIHQVWFSGAHSNVGGGYPKQGMSLVALDWMMGEAERAGLRFVPFDRAFYQSHANFDDKLYDPRAGLGIFYRWKPRDIGELCRNTHVTPKLHASVLERVAHGTEHYAPGNLPPQSQVCVGASQSGQDPVLLTERAQRLQDVLSGASPDGQPLLARVRTTMIFGRVSYYLYLATCTLALLGAVKATNLSELANSRTHLASIGTIVFDLLASPVATSVGIASTLWQQPSLLAVLIGGLTLSYAMSISVDRRMSAEFSQFWHKVQPRLRNALKQARQEVAQSSK